VHLRLVFAYAESMTRSLLRSQISHLNTARAARHTAEMTFGEVPSVIYGVNEAGEHGNFLPAAYRRILRRADWKARLAKAYTGSRFVPRRGDRKRAELDCANSSDALLMNIFCYPGVLNRRAICSLLAIEQGLDPVFGFRPLIPLKSGANDRSEIDLKLGNLFIEAKLTEGDFQSARCDLVHRYRDLEQIFDVSCLPMKNDRFRSCQLIRGALAAYRHDGCFCIVCDRRRPDLIEDCFKVFSAVMSSELRCRLSVITWQELAAALPAKPRLFLEEKYGIF
jgi:hypothetical protein